MVNEFLNIIYNEFKNKYDITLIDGLISTFICCDVSKNKCFGMLVQTWHHSNHIDIIEHDIITSHVVKSRKEFRITEPNIIMIIENNLKMHHNRHKDAMSIL